MKMWVFTAGNVEGNAEILWDQNLVNTLYTAKSCCVLSAVCAGEKEKRYFQTRNHDLK